METDKKPLYKLLNEQRTQGEWLVNGENFGSVTITTHEQSILKTFLPSYELDMGRGIDGLPNAKKTSVGNAEYIALAVNNLHILADVLTKLLYEIEDRLPIGSTDNTYYKQAKEALARIS